MGVTEGHRRLRHEALEQALLRHAPLERQGGVQGQHGEEGALVVATVGTVSSLIRGDVFHWGGLMAGALMAAAPPVILYAFLMDYYISGLTAGATKG